MLQADRFLREPGVQAGSAGESSSITTVASSTCSHTHTHEELRSLTRRRETRYADVSLPSEGSRTSLTPQTLTWASSNSFMALGGRMEPSMVGLLNTPLILLPILLMPNDSPRLDRFLREQTHADLNPALTSSLGKVT